MPKVSFRMASASRELVFGVEGAEAVGCGRISIDDFDGRPSPLPHVGVRRAGEPDLPAGAFDSDARPGLGDARAVRAVRTKDLSEHGDGVITLEGDEGGRPGQPLAQGGLDACTERAEAFRPVAQEGDAGAVVAE